MKKFKGHRIQPLKKRLTRNQKIVRMEKRADRAWRNAMKSSR